MSGNPEQPFQDLGDGAFVPQQAAFHETRLRRKAGVYNTQAWWHEQDIVLLQDNQATFALWRPVTAFVRESSPILGVQVSSDRPDFDAGETAYPTTDKGVYVRS